MLYFRKQFSLWLTFYPPWKSTNCSCTCRTHSPSLDTKQFGEIQRLTVRGMLVSGTCPFNPPQKNLNSWDKSQGLDFVDENGYFSLQVSGLVPATNPGDLVGNRRIPPPTFYISAAYYCHSISQFRPVFSWNGKRSQLPIISLSHFYLLEDCT